MQNGDISSKFTYTPLPDPQTHIRLIQVRSTTPGQTVTCELKTWLINNAPSYRGISYTWGDPASSTLIVLNGQHVRVRTNCEYVLRQAYWHGGSSYIWVDALCINQEDTNEKTALVQRMGEVFGNATLVLACVGPHADDSEFLINLMAKHKRFLSLGNIMERTVQREARIGPTPKGLKWRRKLWMMRTPLSMYLRISKAVEFFLKRPYFTRVWVVQELFLAWQVIICCGPDQGSTQHLQGLLWLLKAQTEMYFLNVVDLSMRKVLFRRIRDRASHDQVFEAAKSFPRLSAPVVRFACDAAQTLTVEEVMKLVRPLKCEDPRDTVYGTLCMVKWSASGPITPDYKRTAFDIVKDVFFNFKVWPRQRSKSDSLLDQSMVSPLHVTASLLSLIKNLNLTIDDEEVARRIQLRRSLSERRLYPDENETTSKNADITTEHSRQSIVLEACEGRRIGYDPYDGSWKLDIATKEYLVGERRKWSSPSNDLGRTATYASPADQSSESEFERPQIRGADGNAHAGLCKETKPGDWLITLGHEGLGLVVRESCEGFYSIVGQAVISMDLRVECTDYKGPKFDVSFDVEDLLVLAVQHPVSSLYDWADCELEYLWSEGMEKRLETPVCRSERSSYAVKVKDYKRANIKAPKIVMNFTNEAND